MTSCSPSNTSNGRDRFAFVADDEPLLREMAQQILQEAGFSVQSFASGESLLSALQKSTLRPQLIVTDFAMAGMSGMDVISDCRKSFPEIKILLVSGTVNESAFQTASAKPDAFLSKPYHSKDFARLVNSILATNPS